MKAYIEPKEVAQMENAAGNLRDRLLIHILFRLGCRIAELLSIAVEDIDFIAGTVTIRHLKSRIKLSCASCGVRLSMAHRFCPGCGGSINEAQAEELKQRRRRVLPIDRETLEMLKEYVQRGGPVVKEGKALIFGINRHRAWQIIRDCADRAGLPKLINTESGRQRNVSPHRLRDAFAVNAVKHNDSGDGLRLLQEHLGHQSITTTMKYRKVAGEELKTWYSKLWEAENGR